MASFYRRNASQRCSTDADKVEVNAIRSGYAVVDSGADDERVSGVQDDLAVEASPVGDAETWQLDDLVRDDSAGAIQVELFRRAELLGSAYPFRLEDGTLLYGREAGATVYEFLLAASLPAYAREPYLKLASAFERVATQIVAAYFGANARSIHIGWPRAQGGSFRKMAAELHRRTGEWRWGPEDGLDPKDVKDDGCDFVIWLDASDARQVGQLFVLGQCACGNNWLDKLADLDVKKMARWFKPLSLVDPVRSFATPRHVADDLLREASRKGGLIFDRSRLVRAVESAGGDSVLDVETVASMVELVERLRA